MNSHEFFRNILFGEHVVGELSLHLEHLFDEAGAPYEERSKEVTAMLNVILRAATEVHSPESGSLFSYPHRKDYCTYNDYFETVTVLDVAIKFKVGERVVREWITSGQLRAKMIGRQYYITKAAIKEMLNEVYDDNVEMQDESSD